MTRFPHMRRVKAIHFIGIGGSGMSGIAEVLLKQGYRVSGSDQQENAVTKRLQDLGATIFHGHDIEHVKLADAVVISSAIPETNVELQAARQSKLPVLPRAQMLAELMRFHCGIAIAGTHGKTTTTSLVASVLAEGGLDPAFVIGGLLNSCGVHAKSGNSKYFVVEADESDASFLYFNPTISVVTNIDADHMRTYDNDFNRLKQAFLDFLHRLPFYGLAIVCIDNLVVKELLDKIARPVLTYGFDATADIQAVDFEQHGLVSHFKARIAAQNRDLAITLNMPGKHNVLNALATIAIGLECNVTEEAICNGLAQFKGVGRRQESYGEIALPNGVRVALIDDYGHHPREIAATLQAMRGAWPDRRLVLAFQPHRYSRTHELFDDFSAVLSEVDVLLLLEVYAAGEDPIVGIDSRTLSRSIRQRGKVDPIFVEHNAALIDSLLTVLHDGDVLLLQGAGSIGMVAPQLGAKFGQRSSGDRS